MRFIEDFRMAWRALMSNRLRAALTMLGIIIGVAAVIGLVTLGQAATNSVTSQVQSLGTNRISIIPRRNTGAVLHPQDVQWLREVVPQISAAAPLLQGGVTAVYGTKNWSTTLLGTTNADMAIEGRKIAAGRSILASDVTYQRKVAVVGSTVVQNLFPGGGQPIGQTINVNGIPFLIVGELQTSGGGFGPNPDDVIVTSLPVAEQVLKTNILTGIDATAKSAALAPLAVGQIEAVMNARFHNTNAAAVISEQSLLSTLSSVTQTLTLMLGGIAAISLLVGGIGIMNIMLVTVSERTREIGIRKALGARRGAILRQFLVEAAFLSLIGGALGVALGLGGASVVEHILGWKGGTALPTVVVALVFSIGVGMGFGIWPAMRASRLNPVDALRQA